MNVLPEYVDLFNVCSVFLLIVSCSYTREKSPDTQLIIRGFNKGILLEVALS